MRIIRIAWTLLLVGTSLAGCVPETALSPTALMPTLPALAQPLSPTPTAAANVPVARSQLLPGGLRLEEHVLQGAPQLDPLVFQPEDGSQNEVLARHARQRAALHPQRLYLEDGSPCVWAPWDGDRLIARERSADDGSQQLVVELWHGEDLLLLTPAGFPSPALALQGLWTYDGHWALEILLATPETWAGQILLDGEVLNETEGYEEAFSFQLLAGRPFYFYQREGRVGLSFDGQTADLGYSQVPHYQCCSASVLNPLQAEEMVAFFAEKDGVWFYVEVGRFG